MTVYSTTATEVTVHPQGEDPLLADCTTRIRLESEGAGAFLVLEQDDIDSSKGVARLRIDPEELEMITQAAQLLLRQSEVRTT
jgi:hypothetical protein